MVRYGYGSCDTCAKALSCQMRAHFNINGCLDHVEEIVVNTISNTTNPSTPVPTKELTPLKAFDNLCGHLDYDTTDYMFNGGYEEDAEIIETALKDAEKNKEVLDLLFRKGVNIILLDYLHHMNPGNAFETYNKEMRKTWCDLYELKRDQFNMIVDYIEERKR